MSVFLPLVIALFSIGETLSFECMGPQATHINRFDLRGEIDVRDGEFGPVALGFEVTRRGHGQQMSQIELDNIRGTAEVIDNGYTQVPFTHIKVVDKESGLLIRLNLDYPGQLNSSIKVNGYFYRSTCRAI